MARKPRPSNPDLEQLEKIKRIAICALVSDEALLERLVLKGGTAMELIYGIGMRSSIDLDFSIEGDFSAHELTGMRERISALLDTAFAAIGCRVFDVSFGARPEHVSPDIAAFWGGYVLDFKVALAEDAVRHKDDVEALRRNAAVVGPAQRKTFEVDISRFEFCGDKEEHVMEGCKVFVYSPRLIVAEKLRAICQQMPEYRRQVHRPHSSLRARDFFDITNLVERFSLQLVNIGFRRLLQTVFAAKRVPVALLGRIESTKDVHRPDFESVRDTVPPGIDVRDFDYYADFVTDLARGLEVLGDV